jgi:hypothetical protein
MSTRPTALYLAGPMRGHDHFNAPAFDKAALFLSSLGYEVCNPAARDRDVYGPTVHDSTTGNVDDVRDTGFDLRDALAWDLAWIAENADAIAVLPGWEKSTGANAEVALAKAIGIPVIPVHEFTCHELPTYADLTAEPADLSDLMADITPRPRLSAIWTDAGETRVTSSTGGQKCQKPARYDLIPPMPLETLAKLYGRGAEKYADHNWRSGYDWSLSFAALQRHVWAFWNGENIDDELQLPHLAAVAFHAFSLLHFSGHPEYAQFDDRYTTLQPKTGEQS